MYIRPSNDDGIRHDPMYDSEKESDMEKEITITQDDIHKAFAEGIANYLYTKERMGGHELSGDAIPKAIMAVAEERITVELVTSILERTISDFLQSNRQEILKSLDRSESPKRPGRPGRKPIVNADEEGDG